MSIKRVSIFLALALVCTGAQAQSRHRTGKPNQRSAQVRKPRVPDNYKGPGSTTLGLIFLRMLLPERVLWPFLSIRYETLRATRH